jgi:hypothetical protein
MVPKDPLAKGDQNRAQNESQKRDSRPPAKRGPKSVKLSTMFGSTFLKGGKFLVGVVQGGVLDKIEKLCSKKEVSIAIRK